jgi:protease PrsW
MAEVVIVAVFGVLGAIAPALWLLRFIFVRNPDPGRARGPVARLFCFSFLTVLPVLALELLFTQLLNFSDPPPLPRLLLLAPAIGLIEEGIKFLWLRWRAFDRRRFRSMYDGVMFGATISLGFAAIENVTYALVGLRAGAEQSLSIGIAVMAVLIIGRALTAVPAHAACGVMMGYYAGRARMTDDTAERRRLLLFAFLVPAAAHGLYDFLALAIAQEAVPREVAGMMGTVTLGIVLVAWVMLIRLTDHARATSRPAPVRAPATTGQFSGFVPITPPRLAPPGRFCVQCGRTTVHGDALCLACGSAWAAPRP